MCVYTIQIIYNYIYAYVNEHSSNLNIIYFPSEYLAFNLRLKFFART